MNKIISIDPGVTTGYCFGVLLGDGKLQVCPQQHRLDVDECYSVLEAWKPDYILIEDFEVRRTTPVGVKLFSVQLIGVAQLYAKRNDIICKLQKASVGKGYYNNTKLKELGIYVPALQHGMDALRHLIHWFTFGPGYKFNTNKEKPDVELVLLTSGLKT